MYNCDILNILIRYSRPKGFKILVESIEKTNHENIKIYCSYEESIPEVKTKYSITWVKVDKSISDSRDITNYQTHHPMFRKFSPNLYFNKLIASTGDGWCVMMDDDDCFVDDGINNIINMVDNPNEINVFGMKYANNGQIIPRKGPLIVGNIGTPCIVFHKSIINENIYWDGYRCGDYRFFVRLMNHPITKLKQHGIVTSLINVSK